MDSYGFVDNIQMEKANAVARYKRLNNIAKMFRLLEVFIVIGFVSWSSSCVPTGFKVLGEYLFAFSCYVLNQHVVFLLGNVIVILCYFLSRNQSDLLEDTNKTIEDDSNVELLLPHVEEKVFVDENETGVKVVDDTELLVKKIEKPEAEVAAEDAVKKAAKQIERFQRTQSARLKREMSMNPRRELRRSVTERRKSVDGGGDTAVEKLSNEEFRLAVEAFILKQQSFLKQQQSTYYGLIS